MSESLTLTVDATITPQEFGLLLDCIDDYESQWKPFEDLIYFIRNYPLPQEDHQFYNAICHSKTNSKATLDDITRLKKEKVEEVAMLKAKLYLYRRKNDGKIVNLLVDSFVKSKNEFDSLPTALSASDLDILIEGINIHEAFCDVFEEFFRFMRDVNGPSEQFVSPFSLSGMEERKERISQSKITKERLSILKTKLILSRQKKEIESVFG